MSRGHGMGSGRGHGTVDRGIESAAKSRRFEGRFGRMFRTLPPAEFAEADLDALATRMTAEAEPELTPETEVDDEENYGLPAGYTYLGQFIDHDITFDPMSSLMKQNDPDSLIDFRTPMLDLDCVYGRGPDDQPYMYEADGRRFRLGDRNLKGGDPVKNMTVDLPRFHERALIGDKRNDENVIVSQIQGLFLRFHNFVADKNPDASFAEVQQLVRWHYQWIVVFDFLPRIIGRERVEEILPHVRSGKSIHDDTPGLRFYKPRNEPFMPVEFSVAAYRFGHTMVRPVYRLSLLDLPAGSVKTEGLGGRKMIFAPDPNDGLNGFREFPDTWAIDWKLFFETTGNQLSPANVGKKRVQPAYKMDTSLVSPLGALPEFSIPGTNKALAGQINVLAKRNLLRGMRLGLPSGQAVARYMDIPPLHDTELVIGKANVEGTKKNKPITDGLPKFKGNAPLWYYLLAEAQHQWQVESKRKKTDEEKDATPTHLGPVGGRIVGEVLIGLLLGNGTSFLRMNPGWKPQFGKQEVRSPYERFTMGDLVELLPPPAFV